VRVNATLTHKVVPPVMRVTKMMKVVTEVNVSNVLSNDYKNAYIVPNFKL